MFIINLLIYIFLINISYSNEIFLHSFDLSQQKQTEGLRKLKEIIQKEHPKAWGFVESEEDDHKKLDLLKHKYPKMISALLRKIMDKNSKTLFKKRNNDPCPLQYTLSYENDVLQISEHTEAYYATAIPESIFAPALGGKKLDFHILVACSFGLRGYQFNENGDIYKEWGDYNTAYVSTAYNRQHDLIAWSIPGHEKIVISDATNLQQFKIDGFMSSCIYFTDDYLYFFNNRGELSDFYRVNLNFIENGTEPNCELLIENSNFYEPRGLIVRPDFIYISDTFNHCIKLLDANTYQEMKRFNGFRFPNGIFLTPDNRLLVADEHADTVREIDLINYQENKSIDAGMLRSPGSVLEIETGMYKGCWLIADSDNNRVILISPTEHEIYFEIRNVRSCLSLAIIPIIQTLNISPNPDPGSDLETDPGSDSDPESE